MIRNTVGLQSPVPVELEELLEAREKRAEMQRMLIEQEHRPVVSFTLNMPGPYKTGELEWQCFEEGRRLISLVLREQGIQILREAEKKAGTGYELLLSVDAEADEVKCLMMPLEEGHSLGRLFDIDVIDLDGHPLRGEHFGRAERSCLICGGPVWRCARSRRHSAQELSNRAREMIRDFLDIQFAEQVAVAAQRALLTEVCIAPKPGLVDRENSGSHSDMDLFNFVDSCCVLGPYFRRVSLTGIHFAGEAEELLDALRYEGILAEAAMRKITGGVNTHKGAIFSMGIVCVAAGYLYGRGLEVNRGALFIACERIASGAMRDFARREAEESNGLRIHGDHGITGIRGEAAAGFPHVREVALPVLTDLLDRGYSVEQAGVVALLHLMACVDDTNLIARSGVDTLREVQRCVGGLLEREQEVEHLLEEARRLDEEMVQLGLSPGGSADLLAVTLLVHDLLDGAWKSSC